MSLTVEIGDEPVRSMNNDYVCFTEILLTRATCKMNLHESSSHHREGITANGRASFVGVYLSYIRISGFLLIDFIDELRDLKPCNDSY